MSKVTFIETGNFIAQLPSGEDRRKVSELLVSTLELVRDGKAPWILHDVQWNRDFLEQFLAGADTGSTLVQHAQSQVGAGDVCILTERHSYELRTGIHAEIWSLDKGLAAHS